MATAERTAAELGLAYTPTVERPDAPLPCFANWSSGKDVYAGLIDGVPVSVFDVTLRIESDEGSSYQSQTVVLLPAVGLPEFTASPGGGFGGRLTRAFGVNGLTFDPAAAGDHAEVVRRFGRAVRIKLPKEPAPFEYRTAAHRVSEAAVRRLFTTNLMSALLQHPELSVEANAEWLACHRRHLLLPTGERPQLVASALAIRAALLKAAADPTPGPGLAPLPLPTPGQYLSRWLGAGAGALLGFLGGFLSGVYPFSSHPDHLNFIVSKWLIIIGLVGVLFITVVGMVAGGALGYWVGAAVGLIPAVRRWEPNPAETPEQQSQNSCRSKWQTGCGCLGWFMGFFAGAFAFIAVDTVFGNHRIGGWNSVLFFASPMIGMAVGFLAFARIGGRIADRRKIPNSSQVASETGASTRAEPDGVLSRGDF